MLEINLIQKSQFSSSSNILKNSLKISRLSSILKHHNPQNTSSSSTSNKILSKSDKKAHGIENLLIWFHHTFFNNEFIYHFVDLFCHSPKLSSYIGFNVYICAKLDCHHHNNVCELSAFITLFTVITCVLLVSFRDEKFLISTVIDV